MSKRSKSQREDDDGMYGEEDATPNTPIVPGPPVEPFKGKGGKFLVKGGSHTDFQTGETWVKDQIVESDKPLDEMFQNKFERVGGKTMKARTVRAFTNNDTESLYDAKDKVRTPVEDEEDVDEVEVDEDTDDEEEEEEKPRHKIKPKKEKKSRR